jgi:hypothetical protein
MITIYQKNLTPHMDVHIVIRLAKQCIFYQCYLDTDKGVTI